jgi:hypothetical protein
MSVTIFAPAGDVVLGANGSHRGAFVGRTVAVGPGTTVRGDSALRRRRLLVTAVRAGDDLE